MAPGETPPTFHGTQAPRSSLRAWQDYDADVPFTMVGNAYLMSDGTVQVTLAEEDTE